MRGCGAAGLLLAMLTAEGLCQSQTMTFQRFVEPNHQAFSLMAPRGWVFRGGLQYVNPLTQDPGQVMTPKTNFTVTSPDGLVGLEWYEETAFFTWGPNPAPAAPLLNQAGVYMGMPIMPRMDALTFIEQVVVPRRRQGQGLMETERTAMPQVAQEFARTLPGAEVALIGGRVWADAGLAGAANPVREERFLVILKYFQMPSGDMIWSNPITCSWWSPRGQMAHWQTTLQMIFQSMTLNPAWVRQEILRQAQAAGTLAAVQDAIARIDGEIVTNRMATNMAINRQQQLNLMGMSAVTDPRTGQQYAVPTEATGLYVDPNTGEATYTTDPNYDPSSLPANFQNVEIR